MTIKGHWHHKKERQLDFAFERSTQYHLWSVLAKTKCKKLSSLNLIKALELTTNLQEIQGKRHMFTTTTGREPAIPIMENSGQTPQWLQLKKQKTASKNRDRKITCRSKEILRDISTIKRSGPIRILIQKIKLFLKVGGAFIRQLKKCKH